MTIKIVKKPEFKNRLTPRMGDGQAAEALVGWKFRTYRTGRARDYVMLSIESLCDTLRKGKDISLCKAFYEECMGEKMPANLGVAENWTQFRTALRQRFPQGLNVVKLESGEYEIVEEQKR